MEKIIQIMPAPDGLWAQYSGADDGEGKSYKNLNKVVCLALVLEEGTSLYAESRYVKPMIMYADGMIEFADDSPDFDGIIGSWKEVNHEK